MKEAIILFCLPDNSKTIEFNKFKRLRITWNAMGKIPKGARIEQILHFSIIIIAHSCLMSLLRINTVDMQTKLPIPIIAK